MGPFGLRIKLPPAAHLSIAHGGGFTLSFFIVERQAVNTNFIVFGLIIRPEIDPECYVAVADAPSIQR